MFCYIEQFLSIRMKYKRLKKPRELSVTSDNPRKMNEKKPKAQKKLIKEPGKSTEKQKVFTAVIDPYDAPLQWWESEFVKYAYATHCVYRLLTKSSYYTQFSFEI